MYHRYVVDLEVYSILTQNTTLCLSLCLSLRFSLSLSLSIETVRVSDGLHFQLFRRILKDIRSTTKAQSLEW